MKIHNLPGDPGRQQKRKRVGRGFGSGHGKTSTKGHKGAQARSGGSKSGSFEGGQMPLTRRMPKGGFKNPFRVEYEVINVATLEKFFDKGATVTLETLKPLIKTSKPIKLLGNGELTKALKVKIAKASASAIEKIKQAGGTFEEIAG